VLRRYVSWCDGGALWDEARKYLGNILVPVSKLILRKVGEVQQMGLEIDVIAPSHGVVWRESPLQIVERRVRWSRGEARSRAVVVYETMWGSTAEIARAIVNGVAGAGAEVQLYAVPQTDHTTVVGDLLEARGIVVGSATYNRRPLLNISALVEDLVGLKPVSQIGAATHPPM
jgi:flavorubredoxin